jgi:hypothetical protein
MFVFVSNARRCQNLASMNFLQSIWERSQITNVFKFPPVMARLFDAGDG